MKTTIRLFLFLLAFQMEVRVRASGDLLQQPMACMKAQETCAIQVIGNGFHLEREGLKLHAGKGSSLVRLDQKQWRFVKGALWVEKAPGLKIETLYGTMAAVRGQYWVVDQGERVLIRNMNADLKVTLRDGRTLELPEGFEFWIGGVSSQGSSEYGMLQPIDMKNHLPLWNSLYRGGKDSFIKEVVHLRENWGDMAERSSLLYTAVVQREIASQLSKEQAIQREQQRKAREHQKMKELYYYRVFER